MNNDTNITEVETLKAELAAWREAAFRATGAWTPEGVEESVAMKNEDIEDLKDALVESREAYQKVKDRLDRILQTPF